MVLLARFGLAVVLDFDFIVGKDVGKLRGDQLVGCLILYGYGIVMLKLPGA